jgi:hypothetical protein
MANGLGGLERPQSGWDPYEVWRTRVKGSPRTVEAATNLRIGSPERTGRTAEKRGSCADVR